MCRGQLPGWQQYRKGHPDRVFDLLAVAADASPGDVRAWATRHRLDFRVLIDSGNALAQQYGFRAIPDVVCIDRDGIVRLKASRFSIERPQNVGRLEGALDGSLQEPSGGAEALPSERALGLFREGAACQARGDHARAASLWREAAALEPENLIIRKQLWRARHPERFGEQIDLGWQQAQRARESAEGIARANPLTSPDLLWDR